MTLTRLFLWNGGSESLFRVLQTLTDDSGKIGIICWSNAHNQVRKTGCRVQMEMVILGRRPDISSITMRSKAEGSVCSGLADMTRSVEVQFLLKQKVRSLSAEKTKNREVLEIKREKRICTIIIQESKKVNQLGNYSRIAQQRKDPLKI